VDRSDPVSSPALCEEHLPQHGQGVEACDVPEAWRNVQEGDGSLPLLLGGAPTIELIGALADERGQRFHAVGRVQVVPEFAEDDQTVEGVKARNCRRTARGAGDLASEAPGRRRGTDLTHGDDGPALPSAGVSPRELSGRCCIRQYLGAVNGTKAHRLHDLPQGHRSSLLLSIAWPGLYSEERREADFFSSAPDLPKGLASSLLQQARRRWRRIHDPPPV
jgi:hypothetical protein